MQDLTTIAFERRKHAAHGVRRREPRERTEPWIEARDLEDRRDGCGCGDGSGMKHVRVFRYLLVRSEAAESGEVARAGFRWKKGMREAQ